MDKKEQGEIIKVLPYFLKHKFLWTNYDDKADVLYVHFKEKAFLMILNSRKTI